MIRPFISGGLGLSIYAFSYYNRSNPASNKNVANAGFTMAPEAGIRFIFTKNLIYYIKGGYTLLMDGPPSALENGSTLVFPKADQATGYSAFGVNFRFNR